MNSITTINPTISPSIPATTYVAVKPMSGAKKMLVTIYLTWPKLRRQLQRGSCQCNMKAFTDQQLLISLSMCGFEIDRTTFESLCRENVSAKAIIKPWEDQENLTEDQWEQTHWLFHFVLELWERWCPKEPSLHSITDKIEQGTKMKMAKASAKWTASIWHEAWQETLLMIDKGSFSSMADLEAASGKETDFFIWLADFGTLLSEFPEKKIQYKEIKQNMLQALNCKFPAEQDWARILDGDYIDRDFKKK